jgi:UDP-glucose 4-epimerase
MSTERPTILVTGGCGYIGTHTITCLLAENYNVVVVDNLVNSSKKSLDAVVQIVGLTDDERKERLVLYEVDIRDETALRKVFESSPTFQACIHFAGLKVKISIRSKPYSILYYVYSLGANFVSALHFTSLHYIASFHRL